MVVLSMRSPFLSFLLPYASCQDCKPPVMGGKHTGALPGPRASVLDKKGRHYNKQKPPDDLNRRCTVQFKLSPPQWVNVFVNASTIMMAAGPRTTTKSAGKIKNTSGKISLMVVLAAASSTI